MSAADVAVLASAVAVLVAATALVAVTVALRRRVRELEVLTHELRGETVPLVRDARVVVDQAATEMQRVGDVLGSAEAVSATVDSASRLAYRAFSNPVVKVVAYGTGLRAALRRLFGRGASEPGPARADPRLAARSALPATAVERPKGRRELRHLGRHRSGVRQAS